MSAQRNVSGTRRPGPSGGVRGLTALLGAGALVLWSVGGCASEDDGGDATVASPVATQPAVPDAPATAPARVPTPTTRLSTTPVTISAPFADVYPDGKVTLESLLPWDGGFLAIGTIENRTALNRPLPDEVAALFPPEVVSLFPDGLPPTVEEATRVLREAGLYDTVAEIVADNRAARDAIFARSRGPARLVVWSADGDEWTPVDASLPETLDATSLVAAGDHLVGFGTPLPGFMVLPTDTIVATTTDLVDWELDEISPDPPADLPDGVMMLTTPEAIVANDSGWMLERTAAVEVFVEALVAEARDVDIADVTVFYTVENGVVARVPARDGVGTEELVLSWADLGFDESWMPYLYASGRRFPSVPEIWAAPWGGEPVRTAPTQVDAMSGTSWDDALPNVGPFAATPAGFLDLDARVWFSDDGVTWSESVNPPGRSGWGYDIANVLPISDRLAVILGPSARPSAFLVDATGQDWEPIDLRGLPDVFPWLDVERNNLNALLPSPWIVYASQAFADAQDAWLVASLDGTSWLIADVVDGDAGTQPVAALSGSTLLLADGSGTWQRYDLAS